MDRRREATGEQAICFGMLERAAGVLWVYTFFVDGSETETEGRQAGSMFGGYDVVTISCGDNMIGPCGRRV